MGASGEFKKGTKTDLGDHRHLLKRKSHMCPALCEEKKGFLLPIHTCPNFSDPALWAQNTATKTIKVKPGKYLKQAK